MNLIVHLKNSDEFNCGSCCYDIINILCGDEVLLCPHCVVFSWTLHIVPVFLYENRVSKMGFVSPKLRGRKVAPSRGPFK